jgi:hypothetical protein
VCRRAADGSVVCDGESFPNGFEWCINTPAVDVDGNVYALGEGRTFMQSALGADYTPVTIGTLGHIVTLNRGHMIVVGPPKP